MCRRLEESELAGQSSHEMLEPTTACSRRRTNRFGQRRCGVCRSRLRLRIGNASESIAAPWDDSQHMDRLLADLEGQPIDTYEPEATKWTLHLTKNKNISNRPAIGRPTNRFRFRRRPAKPERKRSIVRTLVVSAFGGIIGLGLGYYALLWLGPMLHRGKEIDFLELAQYLPKSILPPAFRTEVKQPPPCRRRKWSPIWRRRRKLSNQSRQRQPTRSRRLLRQIQRHKHQLLRPRSKRRSPLQLSPRRSRPIPTIVMRSPPPRKSEPAMREPAPLETPPAKAITETTPKAEPVRITMLRRSLPPTYQHRSRPQTLPSPGW